MDEKVSNCHYLLHNKPSAFQMKALTRNDTNQMSHNLSCFMCREQWSSKAFTVALKQHVQKICCSLACLVEVQSSEGRGERKVSVGVSPVPKFHFHFEGVQWCLVLWSCWPAWGYRYQGWLTGSLLKTVTTTCETMQWHTHRWQIKRKIPRIMFKAALPDTYTSPHF